MESAVCDTNRKKGNGVFYRKRKSRNCMSAPKIRKHQRDTLEIKPFSFPDASEQKAHSVWPVWNVTALLITVRYEKAPFIKSVFQKQSNGTRVAFSFQESGLCKHGLKSVLNVTKKMIALAMTRTKRTKRTHNRYFTSSLESCEHGGKDFSTPPVSA